MLVCKPIPVSCYCYYMSFVAICMENKMSDLERLVQVTYQKLVFDLGCWCGWENCGRDGGRQQS